MSPTNPNDPLDKWGTFFFRAGLIGMPVSRLGDLAITLLNVPGYRGFSDILGGCSAIMGLGGAIALVVVGRRTRSYPPVPQPIPDTVQDPSVWPPAPQSQSAKSD